MKNTIELSARCPFYYFDTGVSVTCRDGEKKVKHRFSGQQELFAYARTHCDECFPENCETFRRFWSKYQTADGSKTKGGMKNGY